MKGFMHVVEIILVTLLLFFVISQFVFIRTSSTDWPTTKLSVYGNDVLLSMDRKYTGHTEWFDESTVKNELDSLLPDNVIYSLTLRNVIPPEIRVSCGECTPFQFGAIDRALSPFTINGIRVEFFRHNYPDTDQFGINKSLNVEDYDVAVIMDHDKIDFSYTSPSGSAIRRYAVNNFLKAGKGVVIISDIRADPLDEVTKAFFGIDRGSGTATTEDVGFHPGTDSINNEGYYVRKYFNNFPGSLAGRETHKFENGNHEILSSTEDVIPSGTGNVLLYQQGTGVAACIINEGVVNGKGRTVWLSMPSDGDFDEEDEKLLLQSLVSWAAGDYEMFKTKFQFKPVTSSIYSLINGPDMFQGMEIVLDLGYSY